MSTEARALREEAVKLSLSGVSNAAIARQLKVARSSVNRWITSYKIAGNQGIDIHLGRPSKLTQEQTSQVLACLTAGPEACGYDTPLWNLARIADMITKTTGVRFNSNRTFAPLFFECFLVAYGDGFQIAPKPRGYFSKHKYSVLLFF